ncbi:MAG: hypothetical protein K8T25_16980 [Planctomycetia bacterium]|nr:hypothetical protein [Planctomycetia bacterium]
MDDDEHEYGIPAANIGDIDLEVLAQTDPESAREIARLDALMNLGEESKEEFRRLCKLLFDAGSVAAAEILLRRNLDYYEGEALYLQLFGSTKEDEFVFAMEAFKSQFEIDLVLEKENQFLVSTYHSGGGPPRWDDFRLLSQPCEIKFGYFEQDKIEADITLLDPGRDIFRADECLLLFFVNGVWEIGDPMTD